MFKSCGSNYNLVFKEALQCFSGLYVLPRVQSKTWMVLQTNV